MQKTSLKWRGLLQGKEEKEKYKELKKSEKEYYDKDGDKKVDTIHWTIWRPLSVFNNYDELDRGSEYTKYAKEHVPDHKTRFEEADSLLEKELERFNELLELEGQVDCI